MKKTGYLFLSLILMITLTGCVKFNANMDIKKDKSMNFSIVYAVDTTYFGDEDLLEESDKKDLENDGYTVTDYLEGTMKGYSVSKSVNNIDEVSLNDDLEYNLSGIFQSDVDSNMFKIKKGFFKNVYVASFKFDSSNSDLNTSEETDEDVTVETDDTSDLTDSLSSGLDLKFNVNLPYSAISNNATTKNNDNKTLSWSLTSNDVEKIEFEFELYNMNNIYISVGGSLLILLIFIICVLNKRKRNKFLASVYEEIGTKINNEKPAQAKVARAPSTDEESTNHINVQRP